MLDERILRKSEVIDRLGISKATLHRQINSGEFVTSIPIGKRCVGFLESEVVAVIHAKAQRKNIKEVVATLQERRQQRGSL